MRMLPKSIALAALSACFITPALAEEAGKQRFTHEGYTYVYEVKDTKTGQIISGRRYPDAVAFNLSVRDGKVRGTSAGSAVAFDVKETHGAASQ